MSAKRPCLSFHKKKHAYDTLFHLKYPFDSRIPTRKRICKCGLLWQVVFVRHKDWGTRRDWITAGSQDQRTPMNLAIAGSQETQLDHNCHWIGGTTGVTGIPGSQMANWSTRIRIAALQGSLDDTDGPETHSQ